MTTRRIVQRSRKSSFDNDAATVRLLPSSALIGVTCVIGSRVVLTRIASAVEHRDHDYFRCFDHEIHDVRKSPEHRSTYVPLDARVYLRSFCETVEQVRHRVEEFAAEVGLLRLVPVAGVLQISLRDTAYSDVAFHCLRRRSRTSTHGD